MAEQLLNATHEMQIVYEICGWETFGDAEKHYFIKAYLLHWIKDDTIHELTERDKNEQEKRMNKLSGKSKA